MTNANELQITTPSEREMAMTRVFDAPANLVFDAWTKPELLKRWLGVRGGWSMSVCEVDLTVGGQYRFVWSGPDRSDMGMGGVYREIASPKRLVSTEQFDDPWYPGEAVDTLDLVEENGKTTLTATTLYDSQEIRDAVLGSGAAGGIEESYEELDNVLASMAAAAIQ